MFLTKDNQIKWKKIGVAALVTSILVLLGIVWLDKPLFVFMRQFDCGIWKFFDVVFSGKIWLLVSFVAAAVLCVKKLIKSEISFKPNNLLGSVRDCVKKTKASHANIFRSVGYGWFLSTIIRLGI